MASTTNISPHPSPSILSDTELSSPPSNASEFANLFADAKQFLTQYPSIGSNDPTRPILRAAIEHLPMDGRVVLMREIVWFGQDLGKLKELASFFSDAVLKPMLLKRSPSTPSTSPSPDAAAEIEALKAQLELSTQSRQAALKAICIRRDGYRCVITKARDHVAVMDGHVSSEGHRTAVTVCAHVISFGLRKLSEEDERERDAKTTIWWALYRYFPSLKGHVSPGTIDKPENAMTLEMSIHAIFDRMDLALEPLHHGAGNVYRVHVFGGNPRVPSTVRLRSHEANISALPHPELLRAHFAVASILHVSGLGSRIWAALDTEFWEGAHGAAAADGSTDLAALVQRRMLIGI